MVGEAGREGGKGDKLLKAVVGSIHMSDESSRKARSEGSRTVGISSEGGEVYGAMIYLTSEQLSQIGIDPERTEYITVRVSDGRVHISACEASEDDRLQHSAD